MCPSIRAVHLLSHLLRSPSLTGAVAPSSQYLARAMADAAHGADRIIELGAGTGPVTRALARQLPAARLTVVELQPTLARKLVRAFPHAQVLAQPAAWVLDRQEAPPPAAPGGNGQGAPADGHGRVALVSSLPFRSLPPPVHQETRDAILRFLTRHGGSWLVQFTYQRRAPFEVGSDWRWERGRTVVANIPPATVWTLRLVA